MTSSPLSLARARIKAKRLWLAVGLLGCATLLAACGKGEQQRDDTQIAVRVNKGEISVHQVQSVLQRQPKLASDTSGTAPARVLEVLIDQELAAQAAREQGLEQDPSVVQAMEASRRETLARAFHDRVAEQTPTPSSDEIDRYYNDHPDLFAKRRLYILQEFAFEAAPKEMDALQALTARAHSVDEMAELLRTGGYRVRTRQFVQAAEDLPLALLEPMGKLPEGGSLLLPQQGGARVFTVVRAQLAPVERQMASPLIANFIRADNQRKGVGRAMTELRNNAKLQYMGSFAKGAASAPAPGAASAP